MTRNPGSCLQVLLALPKNAALNCRAFLQGPLLTFARPRGRPCRDAFAATRNAAVNSYQKSLRERAWLEKQERVATLEFAQFVVQVRI